MFIGTFQILHIRATKIYRQPRIHRLHFQPRIDNRFVGLGMAHHRCQDKQRVLPFALINPLAVLNQYPAIIVVDKGVRPAL